MTRRMPKFALSVALFFVAAVLVVGAFAVAKNAGWLSVLGIESTTNDSQVVNAIERTQEVSLLSLNLQGITDEKRNSKVFGKALPGTGEKVFLQYKFKAKLGIDGADVKIKETGESAYLVSIPDFIFIGYDDPTFKVITEDSGVLSSLTPDIDRVQMINRVLGGNARKSYLTSNEETLRDQTKVFYNTLINSIDPAIVTTFEFRP